MAFCPNCGTNNNEGSMYCFKCGGIMPAAGQPAPQAAPQPAPAPQQPQTQPFPQAPEGFQPIPPPSGGNFRPITPENPLPMTPIQPVYAQPITQPVQKRINKPKSNGFCNAGLTFSIIGLCTVGSTSLIGLILSVIGFFSAKKKNQPGAGKAIAGMIMSGFIVLGLTITFAMCWNDLKEEFESGSINNPIDLWYALDGSNERHTSEYQQKITRVTGENWVNSADGNHAYLVFGSGSTFKFFDDVDNVKDNYISGKCRIYIGTDAMDQVERRYRKYITKSDVNKLISKHTEYKRENFVLLIMENDGQYKDGTKIKDGKWTTMYYGFCYKTLSGTYRLVITDMVSGTSYDFATEKYFKANRANQG